MRAVKFDRGDSSTRHQRAAYGDTGEVPGKMSVSFDAQERAVVILTIKYGPKLSPDDSGEHVVPESTNASGSSSFCGRKTL